MSSSQMKLIIILMSIASLGLVGFQYYWIRNALRINEERFEQAVYQSLAATIAQIEKDETSDVFLDVLAQDTMLQQSLVNQIEPIIVQIRQRPISGRKRPSVIDTLLKEPIPQISQSFKRLIEYRGLDKKVMEDLDNFFTTLTPEIASSMFTPDEMEILLQERERQLNYLDQSEKLYRSKYGFAPNPDFVEEYNIPMDFLEKIRVANQKIALFDRAWGELIGKKDVFSRMDTGQVNQILKNNLKEKGIEQPFDLGIINEKGKLFPVTALVDSFSLVNSKMQARLFPGDIIPQENYLFIHFPYKRAYVFRQIWLPVLSSVLFIGIVIFCFVYAIRVIIRQKNLSEIKNDFINNMTHEFKTPIATVSLAVEALQDPELLNQESFRKRYLTIIKDENKRLGGQVEKVLQAATLEKKEFSLKMEYVDLTEILENAKSQFELQVENKGGKITLENRMNDPNLMSDPFHLSHIINNLLDNANKYSRDSPIIHIKAWDQNGFVFVSIQDNGIGMSKEATKKIFDKFYRIPTGNVHDVKGFGLGLSYVKTIIEAHKGEISVNSEPGKGSIFTIKLPKTP
ncbi:sensor histidine kinase [Cognataquiflexum rubidum]|uniref:sensor histidine kinase n=1 Tax=Cognataquiflexum rubidum TaxID=2922273 RepID=UPI001F13D43F|nr:HAMP domain-containing sensor histidine kinase [Cognataquiflexum rubidum]MCH6233977.1 HAMP domain-containing histidine kinase [Cognataquiflexum rubidum]